MDEDNYMKLVKLDSEGLELKNAGKHRDAIERFEESDEKRPTAIMEMQHTSWRSAMRSYRNSLPRNSTIRTPSAIGRL